MAVKIITAPTWLPIGLEETKNWCRVVGTDDDAGIALLMDAAVTQAEDITGKAFITRTLDWILDTFDTWALGHVIFPPLQSVTHIKYFDPDGVEQTWAATNYKVDADSDPGRITLRDSKSYPDVESETNSVTVRLVAGYGNGVADVPAEAKIAMMKLVLDMYENRESWVMGVQPFVLPATAEAILFPLTQPTYE